MSLARYSLLGILLATTACGAAPTTTSTATPSTAPTQQEQFSTLTREEKDGSVVIHSSISGTSDIKNWRVLDNSHIVFETYQHGDLIATFMMPCHGIRFTDTIGISTLGPFELDKFARVSLPDGGWCQIKELKPFEKLEE